MPKPIQINIPDPCSQNWDEMTADLSGRFCAHCQKTVIDFTSYSDTALYQYFSKNNSHVCGRFLSTQLDRPINIPYQPHSQLYRIAIAFGMTLLFTQTPHLLAQNRPPKTEQSSVLKPTKPSGNNYGEIRGLVFDEKKEPLINGTVQVYQNNVLKGGAVTDYNGYYIVKHLEPGNYEILVLYAGYDSIRENSCVVTSNQILTQDFQMKHRSNSLRKFVRLGGPMASIVNNEPKIKFIKEDIKPLPDTQFVTRNEQIAEFPKQERSVIKPPLDSSANALLRQIQAQQQQMQPDQNTPSKRTFTREEINQIPH